MDNVWEEILVLAGEGGRITLLGSKNATDTWRFRKETNEAILADLLDDEDLSGVVYQKSKEVSDWIQAIALLGRSWMNLRPRYIHPEFRQHFWKEVNSKNGVNHLGDWESLCFQE
jgi:hypothetical protein